MTRKGSEAAASAQVLKRNLSGTEEQKEEEESALALRP